MKEDDAPSDEFRAFRGVWIPAEIWLSDLLTLQEKVMLVEINSLQHPARGCFKSNRQFAQFFQLSPSRVSEIISSLAKKGLVRIASVTDGDRVAERRIFMSTPFEKPKPPLRNPEAPLRNPEAPPSGKAKESNTVLRGSYELKETRVRAPACPDEVSAGVWQDFLTVRKAKRSPITELAMQGIRREAVKSGITLEQALIVCVERGWQGFRSEWYVQQDGKPDWMRTAI